MSSSSTPALVTLAAKALSVPPADISPSAPLESLGFDSLGLADFVFDIEDELHVEVPIEQLASEGGLMQMSLSQLGEVLDTLPRKA